MSNFYNQASWVLVPSGIEEDIVFAQKPISGLGDLTFTRASDATYTDASGVVRRSPYNLLTFSEMFSDVAWIKGNVTVSINSTTAPNGTLTADTITASGASATKNIVQFTSILSGFRYNISIYAKKNTNDFIQIYAGASLFGTDVWANFNLATGTVGSVGTATTASIQDAGNGWYRCSISALATGTGNTFAGLYAIVSSATAPRAETNTLSTSVFIWGAQLVEGTSALDYFPTTNRQDVPRIDFRNADGTLSTCGRLLLEPQRTNSIRNSSMVGAVAGTPGTLPTNWSISNLGTLTRTVVGTGTENGLPYIDYRIQGTASNTTIQFAPEPTTQIAATNGQAWASSYYLKSVAGTIPDQVLRISQLNSGGTNLATNTQSIVVDGTLKRYSYAFTMNQATTAFVFTCVQLTTTVGAAYDFTIRIAAPQMELGAYATTWVPTTTAAVTRLADVASKTGVSSLIGQTEGTLFVDIVPIDVTTTNAIGINAASTSDRILIFTGSGLIFAQVRVGGISQFNVNTSASVGVRYKAAIAYKGSDFAFYLNGTQIGVSSTGTVPACSVISYDTGTGISPFVGRNNQAALFPTRLTNAELVQLTTL